MPITSFIGTKMVIDYLSIYLSIYQSFNLVTDRVVSDGLAGQAKCLVKGDSVL